MSGSGPGSGPESQQGLRLQRVLAQAGLGSRRACEQLIEEGRVEVNGEPVRVQGKRVDPERDTVRVDGSLLPTIPGLVHLAVNKPRGMLSTMSDPQGRLSLADLLQGRRERLFHVGRLDADTEGLLLVTNDGQLAHRLAHPSYEVAKTYLAEVPGPVPRDLGRRLRAGVDLDDGPAQVDSFRVVGHAGARVMVEVVLHEGRKHVVRRLLATVGHPVDRLVRTHVGPVALGSMRPRKVRDLTLEEVRRLYDAVGL
ncbi:MAG: rRNA pseudouridine synthase [Acidothermales bacterium]|nr:rRNA pseudouridine synthase [Acidothermales bacterium]